MPSSSEKKGEKITPNITHNSKALTVRVSSTKGEKNERGIASMGRLLLEVPLVGLSLLHYGRSEPADVVIA
jgi:hypothetical protein